MNAFCQGRFIKLFSSVLYYYDIVNLIVCCNKSGDGMIVLRDGINLFTKRTTGDAKNIESISKIS